MKCIEDCGYQQRPDNIDVLKAHLEDCLANGACRRYEQEPKIVWRDGQFAVAFDAKKDERVFAVNLVRKKPMTLGPEKIKTGHEVAKAKRGKPRATRGGISGPTTTSPDKQIRKTTKSKDVIVNKEIVEEES